MSKHRDVEFLFEMGQIRLIDRMWRRYFLPNCANLADHTFRVALIALALAKKEGVKDEGKVVKMALLHDIAESRTGDADYLGRLYVDRNEKLAIDDMLKDTVFENEFKSLWEELEKRETLESKIVKDADNLDVDFELREQSIQTAAIEFAKKREASILYTKTAKEYWEVIHKSDPHDWHIKGRNRYTQGDWKDVGKK